MLDATTLAAYSAAAGAAARAEAVRDSLGSGTLTVELRNGETLVYSGTFPGPMTASAGALTADALLSGAVTTGGTPSAATWTCRIGNGIGRYIEGSFGPGGRFTWSGDVLVAGQAVRLNVRVAPASNELPAWVPEPGTFANISTNTLLSARPTGWPGSDIAGPFINWTGGVFCPDFGTAGGYAVFGSGHLAPGSPLWAGVWVFDLASLSWVGRNVPGAPLVEDTTLYDSYGLSTEAATLGHPYPPHTYDGLVYRPSANGGGSDGHLVNVCSPGSDWANARRVLAFDLSSPSSPPTRVIDDLTAAVSSYPATCLDAARGGFWATSGDLQGALSFVSFADWSISTYSGVVSNTYGGASLVYVPDRDCIVALSHGPGLSGVEVRVCPIVGGVPQGWTLVTQSGEGLENASPGGVWSTILGKIVSYAGIPSYASSTTGGLVVSLLAIPESLTGGTWAWTTETLSGAGGAAPVMSRDGNGDYLNNGAWSRFAEVAPARCFVFAASVDGPVQAWRLGGM